MRRELSGIAYALVALFLAGALVAYAVASARAAHAGDASVRSSFGAVGDLLGRPLVLLLGWAGAVFVPALPTVHALRLFGGMGRRADRDWLLFLGGLALLVPVVAGLALGVGRETSAVAGMWGGLLSFYFGEWFGALGAWLVVVFAACLLTAGTLAWNPVRALLLGRHVALPDADAIAVEEEDSAAAGAVTGRKRRGRKALDLAAALEPPPEEMPAIDPSLAAAAPGPLAVATEAIEAALAGRKRKAKPDAPATREERIAAELSATADPAGADEGSVSLPPKQILASAPARNVDIGRKELDAAGVKLMEALRTFKIEGQLVGRTVGPTVTQFEIEPAPGVKVRQIASLADDLALAMRAPSIRIVAPIPGKGAVGIEVPNATREMVVFRDIVESPEFDTAKAALPIALGKDLEGRPVIADLAKMPHLLIAGATGAGKSVCVNTIITSLIYRHTPKSLRFLMVDPKMVELSVYNDLPHMRHKVITDSKDAAAVLNRRVRDGATLKRPRNPEIAFEERTYTKGELPYIVVVIDEMADLMMTVQGEVETPIARLAQKARAIGIHLIIATQRPSVNVITGLIKANFPSRIAFRVASQVDSRTILDGVGAETLLGNGDMLLIPPGKSEPSRLQGAYLSSEETEKLMEWYRDRRAGTSAAARELAAEVDAALGDDEPDILQMVREREALDSGKTGDEGDASDDERDKLFREAAEVVIQHQQGSTSLLQRRLKVGYGRAARIIDQLHSAGVLGPPDGSKPRDVLVGLDELDRLTPRG
jgi:S-DNA-T family DNA segregation ATPase FtsK/SpoIIIE